MINRYIRLYKALLRFSMMNFMVYRASFFSNVIAAIGWGIFQIIWIGLLTLKTTSAFGWSKDELILLAITYTTNIGVFHLLFSRNFDRLSQIIDKGELDFLLLKPVDAQFLVTNYSHNYSALVRIAMGIAFLLFFLTTKSIAVSVLGVVGYILLSIFGLVVIYSIWLIYCSLLVWFPRLTNIVEFLYTINGMARYPVEMMSEFKNITVLFIIPFAFTMATPTKVLIRNSFDGEVGGLILSTVFLFFLSRTVWKYSLTHYISASS